MKEPSDDIFEVLLQIAKSKKMVKVIRDFETSIKKVHDIDGAACVMLKDFFDGKLGKIILDDSWYLFVFKNKCI